MLADFNLLGRIRAFVGRFTNGEIPEEELEEFIGSEANETTAREDIEELFEVLKETPEIIEELSEEAAVQAILSDLSPNLQYEDEGQNGFSAYGSLSSRISSGGGSSASLELIDVSRQDYFAIKYYDRYTGKGRFFRFSLLPAIENKISPLVAGQTVPGVQPGIMINTSMRHRNILIPGSTPVYQAVGLESVEIRLCGLLSGDETVVNDTPGPINFTDNSLGNGVNAYELAQFFREEVVIPGVAVDLDLFASAGQVLPSDRDSITPSGAVHIQGKLLIKNFRSMSSRASRDYYCIDAFLINYKLEKRENPKGTQSAEDLEICQLSAQRWREKREELEAARVAKNEEAAAAATTTTPATTTGTTTATPATPTATAPTTDSLPSEPVSNACLTLLNSNGFDISDLNKVKPAIPVAEGVQEESAMVGEGEVDPNAAREGNQNIIDPNAAREGNQNIIDPNAAREGNQVTPQSAREGDQIIVESQRPVTPNQVQIVP